MSISSSHMSFSEHLNRLKAEMKKSTTTTYTPTLTISTFYSSKIDQTEVQQTTEDITTYLQTITYQTQSSTRNITEVHHSSSRNKILLSLIISLIFISLCIGLTYCILIYFHHYLYTKSNIKHDEIVFNRKSFISTADSNSNALFNVCKTKTNQSSEAKDQKNEENCLSIDTIQLFRNLPIV